MADSSSHLRGSGDVGGLLYLLGALFMVWNVWATILGKLRDEKPMNNAAFDPAADRPLPLPLAA